MNFAHVSTFDARVFFGPGARFRDLVSYKLCFSVTVAGSRGLKTDGETVRQWEGVFPSTRETPTPRMQLYVNLSPRVLALTSRNVLTSASPLLRLYRCADYTEAATILAKAVTCCMFFLDFRWHKQMARFSVNGVWISTWPTLCLTRNVPCLLSNTTPRSPSGFLQSCNTLRRMPCSPWGFLKVCLRLWIHALPHPVTVVSFVCVHVCVWFVFVSFFLVHRNIFRR